MDVRVDFFPRVRGFLLHLTIMENGSEATRETVENNMENEKNVELTIEHGGCER